MYPKRANGEFAFDNVKQREQDRVNTDGEIKAILIKSLNWETTIVANGASQRREYTA